MIKLFKNAQDYVTRFLINFSTPKAQIILEQNELGFYIVKAWGSYLTTTLTKDRQEAEDYFNETVEHARGNRKMSHVIIKEAILY